MANPKRYVRMTRRVLFQSVILATLGPKAFAAPMTSPAWKPLFPFSKLPKSGAIELSDKTTIQAVDTLDLEGPHVGHDFQFGKFAINGRFSVMNGVLLRTEGRNAAVNLGTHENFELEGMFRADGEGGMFMLVGWQDGQGYMISTFATRKSGHPWYLTEYRGGKAIEESEKEIGRLECKGPLRFRLMVDKSELTLTLATTTLAKKRLLERYQAGQILFGTYDTKYGPRNLEFVTLRIRGN